MILKGKVRKFGDDVNTDDIIPARFLNTTDPKALAAHCMAGIDEGFAKKITKGDILVAGKNFGCGSSREHAPIAIKACGVSCVIARSFARIFYRNSINIGLPILESDKIYKKVDEGEELEVNTEQGRIENITNGDVYSSGSFPEFMEKLIKAGGLMKWVKKKG